MLAGHRRERVEVDDEFVCVERDVDDPQPADPGRAVGAVARMAADRLGDRHDRIARLGERGVDGQVADHACHQAVLRIVGVEQLLQQLHAQRLDLVDVLRSGEPPIDRADVALRGTLPDLAGEQPLHGRADQGLGREEVDALGSTPSRIPGHGVDDVLLHLLRGERLDAPACLVKDGRIVDLGSGGRGGGHVMSPLDECPVQRALPGRVMSWAQRGAAVG